MAEQEPVLELEMYLIRHGQSRGNAGLTPADAPLADREDPVLSELGVYQASLLGNALADVDFDAVYASPLRRAVMTAAGLLAGQAAPPPLRLLPLLTEQGTPDEYEGQDLPELEKLCPGCRMAEGFETGRRIIGTPDQPDPVVFARAKETVDYLRERHGNGQRIAVVGHACFLTYVIFRICGIKDAIPNFDIDLTNTGVTKVKFYMPGTNPFGDTVFAYVNNTAHLDRLRNQ
ncbi:MAG: histidine phosphatase family protein [Clostridia bacterium]|nr:histidine phosphatase family protein [Clostridia bacterium]